MLKIQSEEGFLNAEGEPHFFWLSFCDTERPVGQQFLGATVVTASDVEEAVRAAWRLGINPGGEVAALGLVDDGSINADHLSFMLNSLRSKEEMETHGVI